jgi:hypothetical protein
MTKSLQNMMEVRFNYLLGLLNIFVSAWRGPLIRGDFLLLFFFDLELRRGEFLFCGSAFLKMGERRIFLNSSSSGIWLIKFPKHLRAFSKRTFSNERMLVSIGKKGPPTMGARSTSD